MLKSIFNHQDKNISSLWPNNTPITLLHYFPYTITQSQISGHLIQQTQCYSMRPICYIVCSNKLV